MIKRLILLISFSALIGCTTTTKIEKVKVPQYYCPDPHIPQFPDLAINKITEKSGYAEVAFAYGKTVDQLIIHSLKLESELKVYKDIYNKTKDTNDKLSKIKKN